MLPAWLELISYTLLHGADFLTYQSKSLEYTVFARASRLKVAESGSNGFVILPSGVTMTRLHSESSSDFSSHLKTEAHRKPLERNH